MLIHMRRYFFSALMMTVCTQPSFAQISANYAGGSVLLGTTNAACTPALEGAIRWSSTLNTIEVCDGQSDWRLVVSTGSAGNAPVNAPQPGYFVLSKDTYDGARGGSQGLQQLCLDILQTEDWLGKADAVSRNLLTTAHVKPWVCYSSICEELAALGTYRFGVAGSPTVGGGSFTVATDSKTIDSQAWNGPTQFGGTYTYWTGRETGTANTPGGGASQPCQYWTSNEDIWSVSSAIGNTTSNNTGRWNSARPHCINLHRFICVIHP